MLGLLGEEDQVAARGVEHRVAAVLGEASSGVLGHAADDPAPKVGHVDIVVAVGVLAVEGDEPAGRVETRPCAARLEQGDLLDARVPGGAALLQTAIAAAVLPELQGLHTLTWLQISGNSGLQALSAIATLPRLQVVNLAGAFLPVALDGFEHASKLRWAMLPDEPALRARVESINAARARAGLPAIIFRFEDPNGPIWRQGW